MCFVAFFPPTFPLESLCAVSCDSRLTFDQVTLLTFPLPSLLSWTSVLTASAHSNSLKTFNHTISTLNSKPFNSSQAIKAKFLTIVVRSWNLAQAVFLSQGSWLCPLPLSLQDRPQSSFTHPLPRMACRWFAIQATTFKPSQNSLSLSLLIFLSCFYFPQRTYHCCT